jgi:hypothetical protein
VLQLQTDGDVYGFCEQFNDQDVDTNGDADGESDGVCDDDSCNDFSIPNGDKPVFEGSCLTTGQLLTVVFAFILRHCCTEAAICDLLKLLNVIIHAIK